MTDVLAAWVRSTAAGAVFCGIALLLLPEGGEKRAVRLVCGLAMLLILLRPLLSMDAERFAELLSIRRLQADRLLEETDDLSLDLCRRIIMEETEAYIWDAAARLGITRLGVRVQLRDGEELPYPWSIDLTGDITELQREQLSLLLEGELGIPRQRQTWSKRDAD